MASALFSSCRTTRCWPASCRRFGRLEVAVLWTRRRVAADESPARVRRLAERTDLFIVMGCGWYTEPYYPPEDVLARRSVTSIATQLIEEIEQGLDGTDVRPGVIGEIGAAQGWLSPLEERVHRAVSRAHLRTGLPITTHTTYANAGLEQLALFEEEGVDLKRVCVGHCDSQPYSRVLQRDREAGRLRGLRQHRAPDGAAGRPPGAPHKGACRAGL